MERQALRGLARAAAARGDTEAARQLHVRILGAALAQSVPPASSAQRPSQANPLAAFQHILGAAALGPAAPVQETSPPDADHWAHGDYGWFLFEQGDFEVWLSVAADIHHASVSACFSG